MSKDNHGFTSKKGLLRKLAVMFAVLVALFIVVGYSLNWHKNFLSDHASINQNHAVASGVPNFAHIVVIIEENHETTSILGNTEAAFINNLASQYALATNYFAIEHPSLPNYIDLISGTNGGVIDNCNPPTSTCRADVRNLPDELERTNHTWKAYFESMPTPCSVQPYAKGDLYDIQHNPFVYYPDILANQTRCNKHVVPLSELSTDLKDEAKLPDFIFIVPNRCNDMHDCDIATGDSWLAGMATKLLDSPAFTRKNSLLAVTWDESEEDAATNNVPLILAGPSVRRAYKSSTRYDHYSLLHTIEESWGLKPLADNDKNAPVLDEFFDQ